MKLAATNVGDRARLATLAANPQCSRRAELYRAIVALYSTQGSRLSERERALMHDTLGRLTPGVEMAVRIAAAENVADDPQAPVDLVAFMLEDSAEVARPIVLRSRFLAEEQLLKFIAGGDLARLRLCAERPGLSECVTDILARSNLESVLTVLVNNVSARIPWPAFAVVVEKSRSIVALQEPLARRPDLPRSLALKMREWVPHWLRIYVSQKHQIPDEMEDSQSTQIEPLGEISEGSRKLIEKLENAGQLKPGFLLRVLQQGQLDLFELAFARLLQLDHPRMRRVLYEGGPRPVAMACRAAGIDRCVFPTVYNLSRQGRRISPLLQPDDRFDADAVFDSYSKTEALARVHIC